jgi:hypothetical protein
MFADFDALVAATTEDNGHAVIAHNGDTITLNISKAQLEANPSHFIV